MDVILKIPNKYNNRQEVIVSTIMTRAIASEMYNRGYDQMSLFICDQIQLETAWFASLTPTILHCASGMVLYSKFYFHEKVVFKREKMQFRSQL